LFLESAVFAFVDVDACSVLVVDEVISCAEAFEATDGIDTNIISIRTSVRSIAFVDIEAIDSIAAETVETIALERANCVCAICKLAAWISIAFVNVIA